MFGVASSLWASAAAGTCSCPTAVRAWISAAFIELSMRYHDRRACAQAEAARNEVSARAREIEAKNAELLEERKKLDAALEAIELKPDDFDPKAVVDVALGPLAPLLADVRATLAAARERVFDWKTFFARVATPRGLMVVALCFGAPYVL